MSIGLEKCVFSNDVFGNILEERARIRMESGREENCCGTIVAEPDRDPEEREKKKQVEFHSYRYTPDGRLIQASGGGICYRYEYDVCGRLVSKAAGMWRMRKKRSGELPVISVETEDWWLQTVKVPEHIIIMPVTG